MKLGVTRSSKPGLALDPIKKRPPRAGLYFFKVKWGK
jgi:hypothetical protein